VLPRGQGLIVLGAQLLEAAMIFVVLELQPDQHNGKNGDDAY
jgi:hypothetical protein